MTAAGGDLGSWERFERPDPWHMPAAYWFWHELPNEEQIRRQVGEMQAAGIHSFQVQARLAYPLEGYLTEDYLEACRVAVDEAARRGMMVGVYDDYNWQTGHAAGRAVAGHDHLRERQLFWTTGTVANGRVEVAISGIHSSTESLGAPGMAWHYEDSTVRWADWEPAFAIARTAGGEATDIVSSVTVLASDEDGCTLAVEREGLEDGTAVTVFVSARCATSRLVNFLDRAAAERFVAAGYQPFYDALHEYFGSTITYFFFDQPHANFYSWAEHHGNLTSAVPFHDSLRDGIRRRWPEAYPAVLLALLDVDSAEGRALRTQFYEFFSQLAMEIFLGTMHDWTSAKGVLLSGHEVLAHVGQWDLSGAFDEWDLRVNFGLDYFGIDAYRDLTGVDAQDLGSQLSAKLGDSVARSNGRSGTIVEQYFARSNTGSGEYAGHWGLTLEELRSQAFRHHLLGMRQFLFHGFYQTHGHDNDPRKFLNPRFDFPPGLNFEPWFEKYHEAFAIESGRLSEFLDATEPVCEVAVLYPLRTVWSEGQGAPHAQQGGAWYEALAGAGYGYHLIDERDLLTAEVEPGGLRIGKRSYRALVLPGVTTLASAGSIARLRELRDAGVRIIATGATPEVYQDGEQGAVEQWQALVASGGVVWSPGLGGADDLPGWLGAAGAGLVAVTSDAALPWWRAGIVGERVRLAVFNDEPGPVGVEIVVAEGLLGAEEWTAADAHRLPLRLSGSHLRLELDAQELMLIEFSPTAASAIPAAPSTRNWSASSELADGWMLEIAAAAHAYAGTSRPIETRSGWEVQGLPDFSGTAAYRRTVDLDGSHDVELLLPQVSGAVTLSVNGTVVGSRGWSPFRFVIPAALTRAGANELSIEVSSAAANRYYAGTGMREAPEPAGLLAAPSMRSAPAATAPKAGA
ncbi:MAG: hypothetical protein JWP19_2458 [Rhodoglobus sp.]|nr:hypothetical protein [Rhodoglobus sp.]